VTIEIVVDFRLLRAFEFGQMLGLAMRKSVGLSPLIIPPPLGLLAGRSKIDEFSHSLTQRQPDALA